MILGTTCIEAGGAQELRDQGGVLPGVGVRTWEAALSGPAVHLEALASGAVVQGGAAPCRRQRDQRWVGRPGLHPSRVPHFLPPLGPPRRRPLAGATPSPSYSRQAGAQRAEMRGKESGGR